MKREIKFRGKDLIHNEWIFGCIAVDKTYSVVILPNEDWSKGGCVDEKTAGQYTGLKDKNGKEIYEGDIVKTPMLDPLFLETILKRDYQNAVIEYNGCSFAVNYNNGLKRIYLYDLYEEIEVIGNIYDNPELL